MRCIVRAHPVNTSSTLFSTPTNTSPTSRHGTIAGMRALARWCSVAACAAALFFALPALTSPHALAAVPGTPLVPCGGENQKPCGYCDFIALGNNLLQFFVYAAGAIATLLFVYAGILYVTSGPNPGNIEKAHRIFWHVLIGLTITLAAWLIVHTLFVLLARGPNGELQSGLAPWSAIVCEVSGGVRAGRSVAAPAQEAPAGRATETPARALSHEEALRQLQALGYKVVATSGGAGVQKVCTSGKGCTSLEGLQGGVVEFLRDLKENCPTDTCALAVTGGTEPGHAEGNYSHAKGYKVDVDDAGGGTEAVYALLKSKGIDPESSGVKVGPNKAWRRWTVFSDPTTGFPGKYVITNEGTHWDIQFVPSDAQPTPAL